MAVLNRIILAMVLVLSLGLHGAITTVYVASDQCSHQESGCHHRSKPGSPVKTCCANFSCLLYAQCSDAEETAVSQTDVAQLQPFSTSAVVLTSGAPAHSPRLALGFHSPPAQVPFFVFHHAFLI